MLSSGRCDGARQEVRVFKLEFAAGMQTDLISVTRLYDRTMGRIDVRVPDDQEKMIDQLADREHYESRSEFVREAIRNEIRERIDLKQMREAKRRIQELEEENTELVDHREVKKQADIS